MKKILYFIAASAMLLTSCSENDALYYEGEADGTSGIYFSYYSSYTIAANGSRTYNYTDTTSVYSLAGITTEYETVSVPVSVFGTVTDYDREFVIKTVETSTVAEGTGFELPAELVIKGGTSKVNVPVKIINANELNDGVTRYITLRLEENKYFKHHIKNTVSGGKTIDAVQLTIRFNKVYSMPYSWTFYCLNSLGEFSNAKVNTILQVMGWPYSKFTSVNWYQVNATVATYMKMYLQEMADKGTPVREVDGSLMQLAGAYLVDYSAYE